MSFRFRSAVIYDRVHLYAKEMYNMTGRFPEYERDGLIKDIRSTCLNLVKETAITLNKPKGQEETKDSYKQCLNSISELVALFDFAFRMEYISEILHTRAIQFSEDAMKYLYEAKDVHGK